MNYINKDSFSNGQIDSKLWLCEQLENLFSKIDEIWIYGGWYGLTAFLLRSRGNIDIQKIYSYDVDPLCETTADLINENWVIKNWNKIWAEEMIPTSYVEHWAPASPWLGMNVLSINENLIAVESKQTNLISQLEKFGFDIIPVRMRHARTLSGGPHCVTLDTVRDDSFDDYS